MRPAVLHEGAAHNLRLRRMYVEGGAPKLRQSGDEEYHHPEGLNQDVRDGRLVLHNLLYVEGLAQHRYAQDR